MKKPESRPDPADTCRYLVEVHNQQALLEFCLALQSDGLSTTFGTPLSGCHALFGTSGESYVRGAVNPEPNFAVGSACESRGKGFRLRDVCREAMRESIMTLIPMLAGL